MFSRDLGYITDTEFTMLEDQRKESAKLLMGLISSLRKQ